MDSQATYRDCAQPTDANLGLRGIFCISSLKVLCFYTMLLSLALGLIFGAVFSLVILLALPAIVVFAVVMAVLIIATLIYRCRACNR